MYFNNQVKTSKKNYTNDKGFIVWVKNCSYELLFFNQFYLFNSCKSFNDIIKFLFDVPNYKININITLSKKLNFKNYIWANISNQKRFLKKLILSVWCDKKKLLLLSHEFWKWCYQFPELNSYFLYLIAYFFNKS